MAKKKGEKQPTSEFRCCVCGNELTDENSRFHSTMCLDCESKQFTRLEEQNGCHIAIFLMCGMTNTPCMPLIVPKGLAKSKDDKWFAYLEALDNAGELYRQDDIPKTFFDGECNLRRIFGGELDNTTFAKYISYEQEQVEKQIGTEEQRERWGTKPIWRDLELTKELYRELDRQYESRVGEFKGQSLSLQQKDALIKVCKWNAIIDHLTSRGLVDEAAKFQKMVQIELESEQMRKKDEKPTAAFEPSAWIVALEKAGLMADGKFRKKDEIIDEMIALMRGRGYKQTLDAAYQLEMNILNNARRNADQPILYELPDDMQITDELGEFAVAESNEEKEAREYAKLSKVRITKKA